MTDIEPALTADEWNRVRSAETYLKVMLDPSPFGPPPEPNHFRAMALANAALPDDDPRKITRDRLRALNAIISTAEDHCDRGPQSEGWQSDELVTNIDLVRKLRDAIAALLPPE